MTGRRALILAVSLLFAGCAKGFHRGQLDAALQLSSPRYTSSALSVEEIEKLQPQIKLPIRLAVTPPLFASRYRWRSNQGDSWSPDELSEIESWEQRLRSAGIARVQADALLILNVATEVDEYANPASILDLTLVGLWVIPGHHVNALTIVEGAMIDNRNEYLYVLARGEGEERMLRPFAYVRAEAAEQGSRRRALASFGEVFVHEASQLKTG